MHCTSSLKSWGFVRPALRVVFVLCRLPILFVLPLFCWPFSRLRVGFPTNFSVLCLYRRSCAFVRFAFDGSHQHDSELLYFDVPFEGGLNWTVFVSPSLTCCSRPALPASGHPEFYAAKNCPNSTWPTIPCRCGCTAFDALCNAIITWTK